MSLLPAFDPSTFSALDSPSFDSPSWSTSSSSPFSSSRLRASSLHSSKSSLPCPSPSSIPSLPGKTEKRTIQSVSIPHHTKIGGKWVFACRVVPFDSVEKGGEREEVVMGKMEIAGMGKLGEKEIYTVWRSWNEFVEFSNRLAIAFPSVPTSPTSFSRQPPRLSKKLTLFITKSTLLQRQDDLDIFLRRLFDMPEIVTSSTLVKDFFRASEEDSTPSSPLGSLAREMDRPNLTVKLSTPDLRKLMVQQDMESLFADGGSVRRGLKRADTECRDSKYSSISTSSIASSSTITPGKMAKRSPLADSTFDPPAPTPSTPTTPSTPKRQLLRHFHSLQDIRGKSMREEIVPPLPTSPIYSSSAMMRAQTQPTTKPFPPSSIAMHASRSSPGYATKFPARERQRNVSKSSFGSISSFEEGAGFSPQQTVFRQGPTGRLESVPFPTSPPPSALIQNRRPSLPPSKHSQTKAQLGHSPASSFSSINSNSSRNWTTDASEDSYYGGAPRTPPTPHMEGSGKYFLLGNGSIALSNKVPPPPFFPIPPAFDSSYSSSSPHQTPSHSRKSSLESRSRAGSLASRQPILEPILGSPRPSERAYITYKLLHPRTNFILRLPRGTTLEELKEQIVKKFATSGSIKLEEKGWKIEYEDRRSLTSSGDGGAVEDNHEREKVDTQAEFEVVLEKTKEKEKVALWVVEVESA